MAKQIDFSYYNSSGKKVSGAAAFNHYVYTKKGGIQGYNNEIGAEYIAEFIRQNGDIINEVIEQKARRSLLKIV